MATNEKVTFRLFVMSCCSMQLCWVNPRLPNYCPECGKGCYVQLKRGVHTMMDRTAWLKVEE